MPRFSSKFPSQFFLLTRQKSNFPQKFHFLVFHFTKNFINLKSFLPQSFLQTQIPGNSAKTLRKLTYIYKGKHEEHQTTKNSIAGVICSL
jgi:hypothetical protein